MNVMFVLLARRAFSDFLEDVNSKIFRSLHLCVHTLIFFLWVMSLTYSL